MIAHYGCLKYYSNFVGTKINYCCLIDITLYYHRISNNINKKYKSEKYKFELMSFSNVYDLSRP